MVFFVSWAGRASLGLVCLYIPTTYKMPGDWGAFSKFIESREKHGSLSSLSPWKVFILFYCRCYRGDWDSVDGTLGFEVDVFRKPFTHQELSGLGL